eukprot:444482-Pelagomonas_calceolata.AAC.2
MQKCLCLCSSAQQQKSKLRSCMASGSAWATSSAGNAGMLASHNNKSHPDYATSSKDQSVSGL